MQSKQYKWVQVVTSVTSEGKIIQLIGTTNSEDKTNGLDGLIYRQLSQMGVNTKITLSTVCYMNSDGIMSSHILSLTPTK